jgi:hypothetical protein
MELVPDKWWGYDRGKLDLISYAYICIYTHACKCKYTIDAYYIQHDRKMHVLPMLRHLETTMTTISN